MCTLVGVSLENKTNAEMMAAALEVLGSVMMHVQTYLDSIMHCSESCLAADKRLSGHSKGGHSD